MKLTRLFSMLTVVLLVAALAGTASTTTGKAPYLTDADQAKAQARELGRDALVYFWSPT